jgi:micrococcal nuclease
VDGDTLRIGVGGAEETVRLIGVDTPETVDPRRPVERFGKEASEFTRRLAEGKRVELREEIGGRNRDRYGRLLRYVYLEDGTLVNAEIIRRGYGHAYVRFPFSKMDEFLALQRQAREQGRGLWAGEEDAAAARDARQPAAAREPRVYVTREGSQYHRAGCRHLSRSMIPMELKEAARRYAPCGVCRPPVAESLAR